MASPAVKYYPFQQKTPFRKKRVFRLSKSKLPLLVLLVLLFYLAITFTLQFHRLAALHQEIRQVQKQVTELQSKNSELREQLKRVQSDSYIEQMAREKLGLIKPGEARIVPLEPSRKQ